MKKFLIYLTGTIAVILFIAYLGFLFILPNVIDLNKYIPDIQKIVKEQANIDLLIESPKISTNMLLQAGIKTGKITAKLPDGSQILETEGVKLRISIPNLLFLRIKASCLDIKDLKINLDIENGEQFKIVRLIEDILNKKKNEPVSEPQPLPIDPAKIKIIVPNAKITNYNVIVNDLKTGHNLQLKGDKLVAGYFNKKTAKLKTFATILSDNQEKVTANLNLDSVIPEPKPKDLEDDPAEKIELPFVNPVLMYRTYDAKSNISAKLKIRTGKNNKGYKIKGNLLVDNITMNFSGYQLPYSYIKAKFFGESAYVDTNLTIAKEQSINLFGKVSYGKDPKIDISLFTDKIYFNDIVILSKAVLNTLHIKNNLASINAQGYWVGRTKIKTDFKKIKSNGCIIARNGKITNGATKLVFDKIKANLIFEDDKLQIVNTQTYINGGILKAEGTIDTDSYSDIKIHSEKLPIPGLFSAFAPADLKRSIALTSGVISVDAFVHGKLKEAIARANIIMNNLTLRNKSFTMNNEKLVVGVVTDLKTIDGNITNKNLILTIPQTNSTIKNPELTIKLTEQNINIMPSGFIINNSSKIDFSGALNNYASKPDLSIFANGLLDAKGIRKFAGSTAEPFIAAQGNLPIKVKINGDDKKQSIILQLKSDSANYLTPVEVQAMRGKQSILQAKIDKKKDKLHIRQTGFYTGINQFTDNLEENLQNCEKIAEVTGTIVRLNTDNPFINMIKLDVPNDINAKFTTFRNSRFKLKGDLLLFGKTSSPIMRGNFRIFDLTIPEILTAMNELNLNLSGKNIVLDIRRLLLNGSDVNITARTDIEPHPVFTISRLDLNSRLIDLDKLLKVPEALDKYMAKSQGNSEQSDIPFLLRTGQINIRELKSGNITATNTTGRISMQHNNFFLNNLDTHTFDGSINGDIAVNLLSMLIDIKVLGANLNVEKALIDLANVKDALTGTMDFNSEIKISGKTTEEIMKNLDGAFVFSINEGQLGPFGKIENMIMAENIRESQFFQTALGGIINNLATIDTSHFDTMNGVITFGEGVAHINPITTIGNVMSLHIAGDFNLLKNTADMKVRAKLGSVIANLLGPLSQLNPVNLVQATPGLNVVMAKTFFLFCETLTPEESAALPNLDTPLDDKMATKFQIVLKGDVSKPLKLIKSFKWLALASEIEQAKSFVSTLPDPSIVGDDQEATLENILKAQEEKAKEDAKLTNKIKRFFTIKKDESEN